MNQEPTKRDYSADFTVLGNGDDLYCSNLIEVAWSKPTADDAELRLNCDCGTHTGGCPIPSPIPLSSGPSLGTSTFTLPHCMSTSKTGITVTTEIWHSSVKQAGNNRVGIAAHCPASSTGDNAKVMAHAPDPIVITLDSDSEPISLIRSRSKYLEGRFSTEFGDEVIVAAQQLFGSGQEVTRYVTAARKSWFGGIKSWRVTLPHPVWDKATRPLVIQLFLTRKRDGFKSTRRFKTSISG